MKAMSAPSSVASEAPALSLEADRWRIRCPECGGSAFRARGDVLCPSEGRLVKGEGGVLTLLKKERIRALAPFLDAYRTVRRAEGWSGGAEYYRGLPFDSSGRHRSVWRLRARSYRLALRAIERRWPDAKRDDESDRLALRILELGAGNGWFSFRMAERGHFALATDVSLDEEDGLGAFARYATSAALRERVTLARAEMEDLPLDDAQFDLVVAAGSLHYARSPQRAVREAHRVLRASGLLLVLDSPVYERADDGREMVRLRVSEHRRRYGVGSDEHTAGFLVESELLSALSSTGFDVEVRHPFPGITRRLRGRYCSLRGITPPARFLLFVAEKRR
jgi:SAM-dependent methyltransferase